jgi:hypothetical protein
MSKIDPRDIDGWQKRDDRKRNKRLKKRKQMQENKRKKRRKNKNENKDN